MPDFDAIFAHIEALLADQTLATLRDDAAKELNGTATRSIRLPDGPRLFLMLCITGTHELSKVGPLSPNTKQSFGDWSAVPLIEAIRRSFISGGFVYGFESPKDQGALVFIAATPDSITKLEGVFNLR